MSQLPTPDDLLNSIPSAKLQSWLDSLTPDSRLTRPEASLALNAYGFNISAATLASLATRGGGLPYRVFMGVAKSRWGDLLEWAETRSVYRGGETVAA